MNFGAVALVEATGAIPAGVLTVSYAAQLMSTLYLKPKHVYFGTKVPRKETLK